MSSSLFKQEFTARYARDRRARRGTIYKGTIKICLLSAFSASSAVNTSFKKIKKLERLVQTIDIIDNPNKPG